MVNTFYEIFLEINNVGKPPIPVSLRKLWCGVNPSTYIPESQGVKVQQSFARFYYIN